MHLSSIAYQSKQPIPSPTHFKTQQSSNDYISSLCKQKLFKEALRAFDFIHNYTNFQIRLSTYAHLILACSSLKFLSHGRKIHAHLSKSGSKPDVILHNHIINMYGKCGAWMDARKVFDAMPERNVVSWTSMISGCSQNSQEKEAVKMYLQMRQTGLQPDQFAYGSIMRACSGLANLELGRQLHCHAIKSEFGSDQIVQNALVAMYAKLDRINCASDVFVRIATKDMISWGAMIAGYAQQGYELEALSLFKEMLSFGSFCPNEFIFGSCFSACSSTFQLEYGKQAHGLSIKFGLGQDAFAGCSLSHMYAKCGCLDSTRKAFYHIDKPDIVSWNAAIAGFAYCGDANGAISFFSQMRDSDVEPDEITVLSLLCTLTGSSSLRHGQQIHSYIIKVGHNADIPVSNSLLTMYAKCLDICDAFNVFREMNGDRDVVSWNAILTACMRHDRVDEVLQLLKLMHHSDSKLDQITLISALGACANFASLERGNQIHSYSLKSGLEVDVSVANGLIDMYTKCGNLDDAQKVFKLMNSPDVVSWSSLIVGYSQFGNGRQALQLFHEMHALGIKPNHVTFVGVLSACSHVGLVDEGFHYYKIMETDHGIVPTREHISCMVDLFARAGQVKEALNLINKMPYDPDIIVWKTLLAACRMRGDVELGNRAAENILKLDPSNSAAHVLLCNIYASAGSWDDVARVRQLMKIKGVMKVPGQSWITVRDEVHVFSVEDRSHPQTDELYTMVRELLLQMRDAGYVPNQRSRFE